MDWMPELPARVHRRLARLTAAGVELVPVGDLALLRETMTAEVELVLMVLAGLPDRGPVRVELGATGDQEDSGPGLFAVRC